MYSHMFVNITFLSQGVLHGICEHLYSVLFDDLFLNFIPILEKTNKLLFNDEDRFLNHNLLSHNTYNLYDVAIFIKTCIANAT